MSGNSASFGAHLGQGDWPEALIRGLAIPPFVGGVALGVIVEIMAEGRERASRLRPAYGLEMICLILFLCLATGRDAVCIRPESPLFFLLVSVLALAMGLQSATLRRAGGTEVRTMYGTNNRASGAHRAGLGLALTRRHLKLPGVKSAPRQVAWSIRIQTAVLRYSGMSCELLIATPLVK
jgi:uncharacterized membrane protein YoaK (UPF0700 family)